MAKAFKAEKIANKIKNIISKDKRKEDVRIAKPKPKSLSRQEVESIVNKLPIGLKSNGEENPRVRLVKSKKELDELWERLTKNAKELSDGVDTRHGKPMYQRMLDDGTRINYRVDSKSGGATIDINSRNPKTNIRIHIDK